MQTLFRIALIFVLSCLVLPVQGWTQESDTISVVVNGYGQDAESALQNALRAAVQQAVGVLVSAETIVENDEVIKDKILSFSGGFVQTHRQIGAPQSENGLVSIRIAAEVKRTDLRDKLQSVGVIKIPVNPDRLRFEILTKEKAHTDGLDMLLDMLEDFPLNMYDISGDLRYDAGSRKVMVDVDVKINLKKYAAFEKEFFDMISKLGGQRVGTHTVNVTSRDEGIDIYPGPPSGQISFADHLPTFRRAGQESQITLTSYTVPVNVWNMIRPMFDASRRKMVVTVVDSSGNVLATHSAQGDPMPRAWAGGGGSQPRTVYCFPWLRVGWHNDGGYISQFRPATQSLKLEVPLTISQGDMDRITAVHISME